jgi:hypothetical protein
MIGMALTVICFNWRRVEMGNDIPRFYKIFGYALNCDKHYRKETSL